MLWFSHIVPWRTSFALLLITSFFSHCPLSLRCRCCASACVWECVWSAHHRLPVWLGGNWKLLANYLAFCLSARLDILPSLPLVHAFPCAGFVCVFLGHRLHHYRRPPTPTGTTTATLSSGSGCLFAVCCFFPVRYKANSMQMTWTQNIKEGEITVVVVVVDAVWREEAHGAVRVSVLLIVSCGVSFLTGVVWFRCYSVEHLIKLRSTGDCVCVCVCVVRLFWGSLTCWDLFSTRGGIVCTRFAIKNKLHKFIIISLKKYAILLHVLKRPVGKR